LPISTIGQRTAGVDRMQKAGKKNVYAGWVSGCWLVARGKQVGGVTVHTNTHTARKVYPQTRQRRRQQTTINKYNYDYSNNGIKIHKDTHGRRQSDRQTIDMWAASWSLLPDPCSQGSSEDKCRA